jgi:hypothetical protein
MATERCPAGLGPAGKGLWRDMVAVYVFDRHELRLLEQCCRSVDAMAALDAVLAAEGPMVASAQGPRAHPALVESRQQQ